ncbi:MAG: formate C-acetyltransferase/glycerol dehydratase family glycyl radical enzyme [Thermodesulfobacteriota bacterium]
MSVPAVGRVKQADTRVGRVRDRLIDAPQEVCVERARYLTQAMSAHWAEPPLTRMSLAFQHVLENISVIIRDEEVIVGCRTSKLKGAPLFPENKARWIRGDVDGFDLRQLQRVLITPEEKRELKEDILPFWEGRTVEERFESLLPPDVIEDMDKYVFTLMLEITYGIGHFTMNHRRVLADGFTGIMAEVRARCEALPAKEKAGEKGLFYQAVIRSLEAGISLARRYADQAESMAGRESNPARNEELKEMARVCRRVPEHPAETFHEAVQAMYFVHLLAQIESGGNSISLGRIDQNLYPYYRRDIEAGRITPERARELLALLYLKVGEIFNVLEEAYIPGGEGPEGKTTQNVTVGGLDLEGEDATNELSYLALDAYADVRTVQPNFGVRFNSRTPEGLWTRAAEYVRDGVLLHFFNDEAIAASLIEAGHSPADARDYGVVGCLEPNAQGKTFGSTFAVQINGAKCLEFALSNGVDNIFGQQSGPATGAPSSFASFEDLWGAFKKQLAYFIQQMVKGMNCLDQAIAEILPSPLASALIEGPLEKGLDLTRGGALYNSTGVQLIGFSNIVDSLNSVKKEVFEVGRFSLSDLAAWLADDWTGAEPPRAHLAQKVPKYGNDVDEADDLAARVINLFADELKPYVNYRGGAFWPGIFSVGFHVGLGAFTGATPDGRFAGEILGNGVTPSNGAAVRGPTAIMNSVAKLPLRRVHNGLNLNMRFSGKQVKTDHLIALIQSYFQKGGVQVQFNMVDSAVLRAAQIEPDKHRDLIVRVSGYSAVFVNLSDIAQNEIINRVAYSL